MSDLITTKAGRREPSEKGERAFQLAYESAGIFESNYKPIVRFSKDAADIIRQVSECRKKDYLSTTRWNSAADETGLLGELAVQRYLQVTPETALNDFINGLHHGDRGFDVIADGLRWDVKSTKGDAMKFKFSKTNRYTNLAYGFIFVYVEHSGSEIWCNLLGFSTRADVRKFQRDDGQRLFVRVETLRREGVLKPVISIWKNPPETVNNPQPINQ